MPAAATRRDRAAGLDVYPSAFQVAALGPEGSLKAVSSTVRGLSGDEAARRLRETGPNLVAPRPERNLAERLVRNFAHVLALLLWVASLFAFVGGLPEIGWAIIAVISVNGFFTFVQEYRASRLLQALQGRFRAAARVRREAVPARIDAASLVPGDIVLLQEGDRVPADCRLITSAVLEVDQSALTGESLPVEKAAEAVTERDPLALTPIVFAGTLVVHGDAEAVVFATGPRTQFGAISQLAYGLEEAGGPLEREVETLSITTAVVAVTTGLVIWGVSSLFLERTVREGMVFAIGVIVALVPEGLLPTLSLSLAIGAQRMARRNVLVRRLSSIEALGATDVICSDKTGTLTMNQLAVSRIWTPAAEYEISGNWREAEGGLTLLRGGEAREGVAELLEAMSYANNASVDYRNGERKFTGDPTEVAILVAATKVGIGIRRERLREIPFDSFRRMMSTLDRTTGGLVLHSKGAPDAVLRRCTLADQQAALRAAEEYARRGMRVLAAARRRFGAEQPEEDDLERELEFLGLIAMVDPIRPEVLPVIDRCHGAGIRVVIITGDHPGTAAAVAEQTGVSAGPPHVVTGPELEVMTPSELRGALGRDVVFARTTPVQKLAIVTALQEMGKVVAVIGDGVNDAPSLRRADVGVAMGLGGTDVAREAADIILADDNFSTLVDAIEEGRAIFANIRKFVTYVFTSNVAELAPFVAYVLTGIPLPLKVLQVLAVDLGTDLVPALGLGAESPEPGVLRRPPRSRRERLLNRAVLARIFLFLGPLEALLGLSGFFYVQWLSGWRPGEQLSGSGPTYELATTMTFAAIVVGQIGAVLACRSTSESLFRIPLLGNYLLMAGLALEVVVLALVGRVPPLQETFGFRALGWREFLFLIAVLPVLPLADEARKLLLRRRSSRHSSA